MPLAPALAPLAQFNQFVICRIEPAPQPGKPWKTNKVPLAPSLYNGDARDPKNWMSADAAYNRLQFLPANYGVGFVITANDPIFCVDVDDCRNPDGSWSSVVNDLCARFPGAAVELSDSAHGVHIWGVGRVGEHGKKNIPLGLEFYTELRFILLGRQAQAHGNLWLDWSAQLPSLVNDFFPVEPTVAGSIGTDGREWTTEPVEEWRGPTNDDELVRRAAKSSGGAANIGFGNSKPKATFAELYFGDMEALSRAFPSSTGKAYDESSADQALLAALAFWTGKDMERMERIARTSKLYRQKWDDRADYYLPTSIRNACASKREVCTDSEPAPREGPASASDAPRPAPLNGGGWVSVEQQIELFAGCVYIETHNSVLMPGGVLSKPEVFTTKLGGRTYALDIANEKTTRKAFEAFTQSQANSCPKAFSTCFRPDLPPATIESDGDLTYANTYWPIQVKRVVGKIDPFMNHMCKLFPKERDLNIMLSYMCAIVQHPGVKFQWAPLIQGTQGNGKSTLSRCVREAVGKRYTHWPKASKLGAQFNSWMTGKIFYAVEDIYAANSTSEQVIEELKPMITGEELEIEGKGVDQLSMNICGNFIFNTNHKSGLRKTRDDRRFCVFYTPQQSALDLIRDGMTPAYFRALRKWLEEEDGYAIVNELLFTWPIPDEFNPAKDAGRAPETSTTEEAIEQGLGQIEQEVLEAIAQGRQGFSGGWISSFYFDQLLAQFKKEGAIPINRRREILQGLGYDWHPGLHLGRVDNIVKPDNTKSKLYVKADHPTVRLHGAEVARAYTLAQTTGLSTAPHLGLPFGAGGTR